MIDSMTAFARHEQNFAWGRVVWEIKTVNHRYCDCSVKLPDLFRQFEPACRELLTNQLQRGRIDAYLTVATDTNDLKLVIDEQRIAALQQAVNAVRNYFPDQALPTALEILRWPGVLAAPALDLQLLETAIVTALQQAVAVLKQNRQREGARLAESIEAKLVAITQALSQLQPHLATIIARQREKILARLLEITQDYQAERLEQELVYFTQKIDVTEELERLTIHVQELQRVLANGGLAGRRLDFLSQELNREANTLCSKSNDPQVTQVGVALKVLIEQIREQVQNIA